MIICEIGLNHMGDKNYSDKYLKDYDYITNLLDKTSKHIYVSTGTSSLSDLDKFHRRFGNINRLSFIHTQLTFEAKDTNLKSIQTISDKYNIVKI